MSMCVDKIHPIYCRTILCDFFIELSSVQSDSMCRIISFGQLCSRKVHEVFWELFNVH